MSRPRKTPRLYVPLDARFFDDDAIIRAGERAAYLYLAILCAIKLDATDGTITLRKISRLHVDNWRPRVDKLLAEGLLLELDTPENTEVTYLIPGWGKWNMTNAEVAQRAEMGRIAAQKRWDTHAKPNGVVMPKKEVSKKRNGQPTSLKDLLGETMPQLAQRMLEAEQ